MNYDFRKELLTLHEKGIRDYSKSKSKDEIQLPERVIIGIEENCGDVIKNAVNDLMSYLNTSMGISSAIALNGEAPFLKIGLADGKDLKEAEGYRGFLLDVKDDGICVYGNDERGAAQAIYYMEELMSHAKAPILKIGKTYRKPMFSPQMVHSGFEQDIYPDDYLARIAHEGRDAILIFVTGVNETPTGHLDFNDLIYRAARYGIDVYAYSKLHITMHPNDEGAEAHYESVYGKLFRQCPGLKGVTLVGESVGFPSKDEHVTPNFKTTVDSDGLPVGKPRAGWYPCVDYPDWLSLVKKVIHKYKPDADIVFWTYNWGEAPKEARMKLIENLPTDITLMATFEMCQAYKIEDVNEYIADYSLKFEGPGSYFTSEAEAAKKRGIRMYAMANTGGLTWDFGLIPYEPMPQQWMRRYEQMKKAHDELGLSGIMESHHYGFYPSIISRLSKWVFSDSSVPMEKHLSDILTGEYGEENADAVCRALNCFSEGIRHFTPTDNDQYCAFRIGPAFPFSFLVPYKNPSMPNAAFGNEIYHPYYNSRYPHEVTLPKGSPISVRLGAELRSLEKMRDCFKEGIDIIEELPSKNEKLCRLQNLVKYMYCFIITGINSKKWFRLTSLYNVAETNAEAIEILDKMTDLLLDEIKNSESAIPLVLADSRLGWEPSMEYMGNAERIRWKIKHAHYVIDTEIAFQKKAAQ